MYLLFDLSGGHPESSFLAHDVAIALGKPKTEVLQTSMALSDRDLMKVTAEDTGYFLSLTRFATTLIERAMFRPDTRTCNPYLLSAAGVLPLEEIETSVERLMIRKSVQLQFLLNLASHSAFEVGRLHPAYDSIKPMELSTGQLRNVLVDLLDAKLIFASFGTPWLVALTSEGLDMIMGCLRYPDSPVEGKHLFPSIEQSRGYLSKQSIRRPDHH